MEIPSAVTSLVRDLAAEGGRAWLVGGAVRDGLLGRSTGDLDLEVHGLPVERLLAVARRHGPVCEVGRSFGVFRLALDGRRLDLSLPRRDSNSGPGHRGIAVHGDPHLPLVEAARRRDLTINAIMFDPLTGELADPFDGRGDLARGCLRAVDPDTFLDDPLRALRVVQFAARFGFSPTPELIELCRRAALDELPGERVRAEFEKWLREGSRPSLGWEVARAARIVERLLPELAGEDDAAMAAVLDRAVVGRDRMGSDLGGLALMWTVLLHPLAAPMAVAVLDRMRVHRRGGRDLRGSILAALEVWPALRTAADDALLRASADRVELRLLAELLEAIEPGRGLSVRARAEALGVLDGPLPALVTGRDLRALGLPPGPAMGRLLALVRRAQHRGEVACREDGLALVRRYRETSEHERSDP